jgi:hypothetical protein
MQDDLEQRVADMLTDWGCGASTDCTSMAARIIPVVLEHAAKVASEWVADDIEGKRLADLIRAIGGNRLMRKPFDTLYTPIKTGAHKDQTSA